MGELREAAAVSFIRGQSVQTRAGSVGIVIGVSDHGVLVKTQGVSEEGRPMEIFSVEDPKDLAIARAKGFCPESLSAVEKRLREAVADEDWELAVKLAGLRRLLEAP